MQNCVKDGVEDPEVKGLRARKLKELLLPCLKRFSILRWRGGFAICNAMDGPPATVVPFAFARDEFTSLASQTYGSGFGAPAAILLCLERVRLVRGHGN